MFMQSVSLLATACLCEQLGLASRVSGTLTIFR